MYNHRQAPILSADQIEDVYTAAKEMNFNYQLEAVLAVALTIETGCRAGEVVKLTNNAFLLKDGSLANDIYISGLISKRGGPGRTVPLTERMKLLAEEHLRQHPPGSPIAVSPRSRVGDPRPMTANAFTKWLKRVYVHAGLPGHSSHSGRRTFATNVEAELNAVGANIHDLQIMLGHSSATTTMLYVEATKKQAALVQAMERARKLNREQPYR